MQLIEREERYEFAANFCSKIDWVTMLDIGRSVVNLYGMEPDEVYFTIGNLNTRTLKYKNAVKRKFDIFDNEEEYMSVEVVKDKDGQDPLDLDKNFPLISTIFSRTTYDNTYCRVVISVYKETIGGQSQEGWIKYIVPIVSQYAKSMYGFFIYYPENNSGVDYLRARKFNIRPGQSTFELSTNSDKFKLLEEFQVYLNMLELAYDLTIRKGIFRSVYNINILNELHVRNLRSIYKFDSLNISIGCLEEVSNNNFIWVVPQEKRREVFEQLNAKGFTIYNNYYALEDIIGYEDLDGF